MAVSLTSPNSGDIELNWAQTHVAEVEAALNAVDGANVQASTLPVAALAKQRTFFALVFSRDAAFTTTDLTRVWQWKVPLVDGASVTFHYLGASVMFGPGTITPTTGTSFDIKGRDSTDSSDLWTHSIALNATNITGGGAATGSLPYQADASSPQSVASGQHVRVNYTHSGSPNLPNTTLVLHFSVGPVSN